MVWSGHVESTGGSKGGNETYVSDTVHSILSSYKVIRYKHAYTRYYGDKILSKNLDLTQDFPNKILFHSLWEQNLVQNLPKIFRLPEMYSFGKILAQDFQMAAITKILMRRENQLHRFFSWGISDKQKT